DDQPHVGAGRQALRAAHADDGQLAPALVLDLELRERQLRAAFEVGVEEVVRGVFLRVQNVAGLTFGNDFQRYAFVDARGFAPRAAERSRIERRVEREYENLIFVDPLVAFARQRAHDGGSAGVKIEFAAAFDDLPGDRFERRSEREAAALPGRQVRLE